jgi:cystathionine beta-lyase/cystathionine gamma-synthase
VLYPGLDSHPEHELAQRQFGGRFGTMVTFTLAGGLDAARAFIASATEIPFSPSLGDLATTLSHPVSTSHRGLDPAERRRLGIDEGTIRLSLGIESTETVLRRIEAGFGVRAT